MVCKLYTNVVKKVNTVREKPVSKRESQLVKIKVQEGCAKHRPFETEVSVSEGTFTASVAGPFTAFQPAGNIACDKEKVAQLTYTSTEE
jgi:hypothetical protein